MGEFGWAVAAGVVAGDEATWQAIETQWAVGADLAPGKDETAATVGAGMPEGTPYDLLLAYQAASRAAIQLRAEIAMLTRQNAGLSVKISELERERQRHIDAARSASQAYWAVPENLERLTPTLEPAPAERRDSALYRALRPGDGIYRG